MLICFLCVYRLLLVLLLYYTDSQISVDLLSSVCIGCCLFYYSVCRLLCYIIVFVGYCVILLCYTDSQTSVDLLSSVCL